MSTDYNKKYNLETNEIDRIIGMAGEDRTPFKAIEAEFGLSEDEVIDFMRRNLKSKSFRRRRRRVSRRETKHRKLRKDGVNRTSPLLRIQLQTTEFPGRSILD